VRKALFAFLESDLPAGNPASTHAFGRPSASLIASARASILRTLQANPSEWTVTFTGSGTEANQLAVRSALGPFIEKRIPSVWAVSEVEHACVLDLIPEMKRAGVEVRSLKPNAAGKVNEFEAARGANLLSVIGVGNETGIHHHSLTSHILCAEFTTPNARPLVHVDLVAGWGKVALDLSASGAPDFVAIAGHKLGGLAGTGALIHRRSLPVVREGTPNLAGIVALKTISDQWSEVVGEIARLAPLRDAFETELRIRLPRAVITGDGLPRAPNVSHFYFPGFEKDLSLVSLLDSRGFAVSAGSACAAGAPDPSHVLLAMGIPRVDARNAIRLSLHPGNTTEELREFLEALASIVKRHEAR
jgi:cysteine desulfurase